MGKTHKKESGLRCGYTEENRKQKKRRDQLNGYVMEE
jgi:hypothetical protein